MTIKKKDFLEVEYTGEVKDEDFVFDTTDEAKAKETGLYDEKMTYGPVVICIGEGQFLKGLEEALEGKEIGKEYTIELNPEKAFGKKDAKLLKMVPFSSFKKQNVMPEPGMQVNIDNAIGIIKTAAGGRCMVDFNHPLSGKDIVYKVKVNKLVTDDKEKVNSILNLNFNMKSDVEVKPEETIIKLKADIPKEVQEIIEKKIKELVSSVKKISFVVEKAKK